jgi:TolB-like protein/Tfp pilus assembly protein PilF
LGPNKRLDSWKAIGAYLKRDERTVRRWEKEGLPVHRHVHSKKASIYAYPSEIDAWWKDGGRRLEATATPLGSRRRLALFLAAGSVLAALSGVGAFFWSGKPAADAITSIAVLPLANLSGDPQQDYFADGMTEALINELGRISALRVISRSSVARYKEKKESVARIARDLDAGAVLEGAVLSEGGRVRVTVQLIGAKPERQLWAERYEQEISSVLVLQREVARAIAAQVRAKLTPREHALLSRARPVDPQAYEAYLRGRYHWNKASAQGLLKARESFEEAIGKDPQFAPAYAGLADTYAWSQRWAVPNITSPRDIFAKARSAALKALELDDSLAEAHATLAYIKEAYDWDWPGAEEQYRRAIELNPNLAPARHWFALYLTTLRRFDEAFAQLKLAEQLDPHSRPIKRAVGNLYYWQGDSDRAIAQWQMMLELEPDFPHANYMLALAYTQKGMYRKAIEANQKFGEATGHTPRSLAILAHGYGKAGDEGQALKLINHLVERANHEFVSGFDMAIAYMGVGDRNEALRWLETAFEARDQGLTLVNRAPFWFDALRPDPRFQDLLRSMQLPLETPNRLDKTRR